MKTWLIMSSLCYYIYHTIARQ